MSYQRDLIDEIASQVGLYEKIFGKLLNKLVFRQDFENQKIILREVYKYIDIETIFEKQVERKQFKQLSNIVFRYNDNEKQSIFVKKD